MADDSFQAWVDKTVNCSGVLACSVRLANQITLVKSYHESFPEARLKEVMQKLTETAFNLRQSQLGGNRLRWVFEHGRIHTIRRVDGAIAMLAVNNDSSVAPAIENLIADFLAIDRSGTEPPPVSAAL